MSMTMAELISGAWEALGKPEKALIELDAIHYETRGVATLLTKQVRSSDNNQFLATSAEFTATSNPYEITSLIGSGTPAWLEMKEGDRWRDIRCVNKAFLEEQFTKGVMAAAFYGTDDGRQFFDVSYALSPNATRAFRIQYDKDAVDTTMRGPGTDGIQIPSSFKPYVEMLIMQPCIKRIIRTLTELAETDGVDMDTLKLRLESWQDTFAYNKDRIQMEWKPEFNNWKNRARTAQNQSRLPSKSGRGYYGG